MQRPLAAVVVAYGIGLLLAEWLHPPLRLALALLLALAPVLVLAFFRPSIFPPRLRPLLVWSALAALGAGNYVARTAVLSPADLRPLLGPDAAIVTIRGTLSETPRLKIIQRDDQEQWHSVASVRVDEVRREGAFQQASGEVLATAPDVLGPDFFRGQPVEISGVIAPPPLPLAEGLFDFRQYLAARGIYYQLKTESTNDWKLLAPHQASPPLTDRFLAWAHQTLALGLPAEDEPLRLLWAMTLGWRTAFTGDIADPFLRAGTQHMFAIDGLRVALVSGMVVVLLRLARLPRVACGLVTALIIWFYTAATGWEPSAVRASVMMTVVLGGWALKRPGDLLNSLAAAALIILLIDPRQLWQAGFLLSFCVVLVIALVLPPLNAWCDRCIDRAVGPDPLLPAVLVPAWRRKLVVWLRAFAHFCALSFTAWLGSLPLAAKFFHLFSPVSTLANVFAVPCGTAALMANLGALVCGHWLPGLTMLFNHAAWFAMVAMTWVSVQAAALPGAYFYVPEPSLPTIVLYYAVCVAAGSGWCHTPRRKVLGIALLLGLGAGCLWQWQSTRAETDLTVLPLGGGHAVYVDAAGRRHDWLINCGNEEAANHTLKDFLRGQGVNSLPRLALTEASARNCGGALRIDELFGIGELWTSAVKFRSPAYRAAVAAFEHSDPPGGHLPPTRHHIFMTGDTQGCWTALFPPATTVAAKADAAALVLQGDFPGTRILLLSDLSRDGQSQLLAQTNDLRAAIVVAGLPDDGEPLCDALIAAVQPKAIVIADSEYPASRRARWSLRQRLERANVPVFYTRTAGAVKIVTDKAGWRLRTMDGQSCGGKP